ncbi:hypothetical protein [Saccharopolyspora shandongensis]|uniref:hypothetical protein n=1 Tax=Saccharopolyspora shandongensis TaxID=418495 RepID=UPI00115F84F6|nr:hypothetical protein [Saccharopolyspora shandongensis]
MSEDEVGSWLSSSGSVSGDGAQSSDGGGGEVPAGQVDGSRTPARDAEPSPNTSTDDADVLGDAESDDAESDFDEEEFEIAVRPALRERLEDLRGDEESSGDTMSAAESAVDGGAGSIGSSSSSDTGSDSDNSILSEPPNKTADVRARVDGDTRQDRHRLQIPRDLRRSESMGSAQQIAQTVGADQVVQAVRGLVPEDTDPDDFESVEHAVLNEIGSLRGEGKVFEVGGVSVRVQAAKFDWGRSEAAEGRATEQSATWTAGHKASTTSASGHRPRYQQLFFVPAVPGIFALGLVDLPTGLASNRVTSRTETHSQSMRIALPERATPGSDSEYAGAQPVYVPVTFRVSLVDRDGHDTGPVTIVGGRDHPDADPVGTTLSVPTGLRPIARERAVPMPNELPASVLEDATVRQSTRGLYQGKPLRTKTKSGEPPTIYDQVAAQLGSLDNDSRKALREFLGQDNVKRMLPDMRVSEKAAAAGRGWVTLETPLRSSNPLKRLLSSRTQSVQMRAVARQVSYLETMDDALAESASDAGTEALNVHGSGRKGEGSGAVGPAVDVGVLTAAAGPFAMGGGGRSRDQEFTTSSKVSETAARKVQIVRYRTEYDWEVRTSGGSPMTFADAIHGLHWTPSEFARAAGLVSEDGQPHPNRVADITRAALEASGAGAKLARIVRDTAHKIPDHHRWPFWRDTDLVIDFDNPKLAKGISRNASEQLARGNQIDSLLSGNTLSSPRLVEEMLTDQAASIEMVEHGRGHDYHVSLKVAAEVLDVQDMDVEEADAGVTISESESAKHSRSVSWKAGAGFVARVYSTVAGQMSLVTSYHKFGFERSKSSHIGEGAELSFGGNRGKEPAATGGVGKEPRKRVAFRVRYTVSGTHWQEWNQLAKGLSIGRPGMHTPTEDQLPIVDTLAQEENRDPGVVDTDIVVELPAWQADQLNAELKKLRDDAVKPVDRTVVTYDDKTMRQGLSRVYDGTQVVSAHGLKHLRESAFRQLRELSGHSVWELAENADLVNSGISLAEVRGTPRSASKKVRIHGLKTTKRRQEQHAVVEYSRMMLNPTPVLDSDGNPVKVWEQPTRSVTGERTTESSKTGTFSWFNSIEPVMAAVDENTGVVAGTVLEEVAPGKGSYLRKRGHEIDTSHSRSETGKPRERHLVTVDVVNTVGVEVKTIGKIDRMGLFKGKPPVRSAERFTLPQSKTVLVDDRQLQEMKTRTAEVEAQRAHEAEKKEPEVSTKPLDSPMDVAPVPDGHTLATPSWSRGVTEPVDLSGQIRLLRRQISERLGPDAAEALLPVSPQGSPLGNDRSAEHFLSNVQAKLGDLENGGASTQLRWEGRWKGHTYELHVGAELLGAPEAEGIKHGELATSSAASIVANKIRSATWVVLEFMTGGIPGAVLHGPDSSGGAGQVSSESIPQHGSSYGRLGLGLIHVAEWLKQVRGRTQTETTSYTNSEKVAGALASHRADVLFDVRIERDGERIAAAPDVRTVGVSTAVEDTLPADLAQRSRAAEITDLTASQATDEAIQRWKTDDAEVLPGASEFRAVEFRGLVEDLVAAGERAITSAGGSVTAEARRSLRAWFTPHRLEALLKRFADLDAKSVSVQLPPGLGVNLDLYLKIPDRGALASTSGRIKLDGSEPNSHSADEKERGSGSGHAVAVAPFFAGGVSHPEGAKTYEEGRHAFGQAGDWNMPLISRGGHESESEHKEESETDHESIPKESADSPLKDITSTWLHGAEFLMVATPAEHSIGKRRAAVGAMFESGYVIRRSDRGNELPDELVAATRNFAERDQEWTSASDQQRVAHFTLSQATQAAQRADREKLEEAEARKQADREELLAAEARKQAEQARDEADTRTQIAERKWWQAKQHYETQLAHARTDDPALAGAPSDASVTIRKDAQGRLQDRYAMFPVAKKAVDAKREGRQPRARYVVRGDLDRRADGASQAARDFSLVTRDLEGMLDLAQKDRPKGARLKADEAGLIAQPQFLHAEGPTRVEISIEPGPLVRDPAESELSPDGRGWTREDLRSEAERSRPVFSDLSALEQESLRWQAEGILARDHAFSALDGRTADELLALRNDMAAVLARPLSQDNQRLAEELSRNLAQEFHTARSTSLRPSPEPDMAKTVRTPDNGPAEDRPGPSRAAAKPGLDDARRRPPRPGERQAGEGASIATGSPADGDPVRSASASVNEQAFNDPEVEPERPVVLPSEGSGLRREGWGAGLPAEVTGPKRRPATTRTQEEKVGESSSAASKRRWVEGPAAGVDSGRPGGGGGESAPTDQAAQDEKKAQQKQKRRKWDADLRRAQKDAAAAVPKLEESQRRGELDSVKEKALEQLRLKAQKHEEVKKRKADWRREIKDAAAAVPKLEESQRQGELDSVKEKALEQLRLKAKRYEKHKKQTVARQREIKDAAATALEELRELKRQGTLPSWRLPELELREEIKRYEDEANKLAPPLSRRRKKTEESRGEIETLKASGPLTDADQDRLRTLQDKVDDWDYSRQKLQEVRDRLAEKKKELESVLARGEAGSGRIADVGASGQQDATVLGELGDDADANAWLTGADFLDVARGGGSAEQGGADRDEHSEWDARLDGSDLEAWLEQANADLDVPRGGADAGALVEEDPAYTEFAETALTAFSQQDASENAGADWDFGEFLRDFGDTGLFGGEGDGLVFGEPVVDGGLSGGVVSGVSGGGESAGSWSRFLSGVNRDNYFSGDERYQKNCLEASVAFHNSLVRGRQVVAGPAGDVDPARLVAAGGKAWRVDDLAEAEGHARSLRVGRDMTVIFQRADGSAHAINAVHVTQDVVKLGDAQKGEEAEETDVLAATGVWVVELPEGQVVLPAGGSELRGQGGVAGLPAEVTGPKRRPLPTRTQEEEVGESSSAASKRRRGEGPQQKQARKKRDADRYRAQKDAAAEVPKLEELQRRGELDSVGKKALEQLRPKAERYEEKKERDADRYRAQKDAAAEVPKLEELQRRGELDSVGKKALEQLRPKAKWYEEKKKREANRIREKRVAVADVLAGLKELKKQGQLPLDRLPELELREEIERYKKEINNLTARVAKEKKKNGESTGKMKALKASLAEMRGRLAGKQEELESLLARGEAGAGGIAGVGAVLGEIEDDFDGDAWLAGAEWEEWADAGGVRVPQDAAVMLEGDVDLEAWLEQANADLDVSPDAGSVERGADRDAWSGGGVDPGAS